jgi:hypothetical protein
VADTLRRAENWVAATKPDWQDRTRASTRTTKKKNETRRPMPGTLTGGEVHNFAGENKLLFGQLDTESLGSKSKLVRKDEHQHEQEIKQFFYRNSYKVITDPQRTPPPYSFD